MDFNYAAVEISVEDDIKVELNVKNYENSDVITKEFYVNRDL